MKQVPTQDQINKGLENASKISLIVKAAEALADCCIENKISLNAALPMVLELAKRKIKNSYPSERTSLVEGMENYLNELAS